MRLIDADALGNYLNDWRHSITDGKHEKEYIILCDVLKAVENAPTVDAVERKKGKWKGEKYREPLYDIEGVETWGVEFWCSECGFIHTAIEANGRYNFCPNCGADMRGEANEL